MLFMFCSISNSDGSFAKLKTECKTKACYLGDEVYPYVGFQLPGLRKSPDGSSSRQSVGRLYL